MTFKYERWTIESVDPWDEIEDDEGEFVRAEDAINREAVNAAEIATLKAQLKEALARGNREYAIAEMRRKKLDEVYKIVSGD